MNFILKLRHWQVFLILLISYIGIQLYIAELGIYNQVINAFGTLIYFFWYFALGLELTEHVPNRIQLSRTLFIINGIIVLISTVVTITFFNGQFSSNGFLGFIWVLYLMYAIIHFMIYPSKTLKTVELGEKANFSEYIGYFVLLLIWPLGIWWIQPKLNKIEEAGNKA